ncbi:MAG: hypothetical protein ACK5GV_08780 [Bacteroidota bacterium]
MKNYANPQCVDLDDFYEDLKRIGYIRRLLIKYKKSKSLRERLILNHLIILYNVFPVQEITNILFFKIEREYWSALKTFLVYLNFMPEKLFFLDDYIILTTDITLDTHIIDVLRKI